MDVAEIVFGLFCLALFIQLWYYFKYFILLAIYKKKEGPLNSPATSVIICAKNEEDNLLQFLPLILTQDYSQYEVVVVNDCSYDNTRDLLDEFSKKYPHLKIVTIKEDENFSHGKKFALMVGIKGAKYEHLLLTDADCRPQSNQWLKHMMSNFDAPTEIVLGYGAYEKKKGWLNKLIRFDAFYIALQYLSFSLAGKTYMGVGRNLAYLKSAFFKQKGFASHYHIESGDDDLFINQIATKTNTKIEIHPESITISNVKKNCKSWFRQKRRHITTAKHYKKASKFMLLLLSLSQYLFYASFITLIVVHPEYIEWVLSLFGLRLLIQLIIFKKAMDKLGEKDLLLYSPLFEIFFMFFYPILALSNVFFKKDKWKR